MLQSIGCQPSIINANIIPEPFFFGSVSFGLFFFVLPSGLTLPSHAQPRLTSKHEAQQ